MTDTLAGGMVVVARLGDEEIKIRRRKLERLSEKVAGREMELSEQRIALARFQRRYYQAVGRRYVELDEIWADIARRRRQLEPVDEDSVREAWYRRYRADRSAREYEEFREREEREPPEPVKRPNANGDEEAKKLYRTIAVQIHPDRADDDPSRAFRTLLMAELNAAWANGDTARMKAILEEWRTSPEAVAGEDRAAEMQRLDRTIARLEKRLAAIEAEIDLLTGSELGQLMIRAQSAAVRGRDLLADLAAELDLKIELARREQEELTSEESSCQ